MNPRQNISGRRALVTGGSGDIGAAISYALARNGAHVLIHANQGIERAQALAQRIIHGGGSAESVCFDISDGQQTSSAIDRILQNGPVQILVNNAGAHDDKLMPGMNQNQWQRVIDINLHGFFRVTQPLLMPMIRTRWGRVINISSVAALTGNAGQTNYAAAKAGIHGASKSLALEIASRNITVNVIAPGLIKTEMSRDLFQPERVKQLVPMGRPGTPEDVADLLAFLASDAAGYITGQIFSVNGGMC